MERECRGRLGHPRHAARRPGPGRRWVKDCVQSAKRQTHRSGGEAQLVWFALGQRLNTSLRQLSVFRLFLMTQEWEHFATRVASNSYICIIGTRKTHGAENFTCCKKSPNQGSRLLEHPFKGD